MSCFPGFFASLPGVACDRFTGCNINSDQFFLSHCHTDHMDGLDQLVTKLRAKNSVKVNHRVYCSRISKAFIVRKFPLLDEKFVKVLEPDEPDTFNVYDKPGDVMYKLRATGIPARHCPGSVMFLFEVMGAETEAEVKTRILYTGDFRFDNFPLSSLTSLHGNDGIPLRIDELFLDTTFCQSRYPLFPAREQAQEKIWELVHDWVRKNGVYR